MFKEKTPTQRAQFAAEAKFCFSCLRDKCMFRQNLNPREREKMAATAVITVCFTDLEGISQPNPYKTTSIFRS